jgi:hypothetical protein
LGEGGGMAALVERRLRLPGHFEGEVVAHEVGSTSRWARARRQTALASISVAGMLLLVPRSASACPRPSSVALCLTGAVGMLSRSDYGPRPQEVR